MQTATVLKCISGLALIAFALPRLDFSTNLEMVFSVSWLLFVSLFVIANWRTWRIAGKTIQLRKEYHWRLAWLQRKKRKDKLERSY